MRTHLDLFSGIGGFALACRWCGVETIGFCEIEPYAQQVIKKNFNALSVSDAIGCDGRPYDQRKATSKRSGLAPCVHADIFALNGGDYAGVWLVTGGFPCQPFSCAGKRRGKEDDRHLWPEMRRVIAEAGPAWVLAENVPGIIGMELDNVLSDLEGIGYAAWPIVVPACAVDARHRRDRVWIVAHHEERGIWSRLCQTGKEQDRNQFANGGGDASDSGSVGYERSGRKKRSWPSNQFKSCGEESRGWQWLPEPGMGRVAHGIPRRVDRLKGLGNAIVPQVAAQIIRAMIAAEASV